MQKCNSTETMRKAGLEFIEMITKLLQRLLEYRHIIQDEIKDHRKSCIVNLLVRTNCNKRKFCWFCKTLINKVKNNWIKNKHTSGFLKKYWTLQLLWKHQ